METGISSTEGSEVAAETQPSPTPPSLSIEDYGDHLVSVKIEGQMETMRLRDALRGVAHQRKVTEVTQDLQRYQQFFNQLEANPEFVVGRLQEQFGLINQPNEQEITPVETDDQVGSMAAEIEELKNMLQEQAKKQAQDTQVAQVNRELDELASQWGEAFDRQAVLAYAVDNGIDSVKVAFQSWKFENQSQEPVAPAPTASEHAAVLGAIAPGSPTLTPAPVEPDPGPAKSPMDAVRRALESMPEDSSYRQGFSLIN